MLFMHNLIIILFNAHVFAMTRHANNTHLK